MFYFAPSSVSCMPFLAIVTLIIFKYAIIDVNIVDP